MATVSEACGRLKGKGEGECQGHVDRDDLRDVVGLEN